MIGRGIVAALALWLATTLPAFAAGTINSLPPISPFPLVDPGCPTTSTENLWITHGNGGGSDYRITPTQLGYVYQGTVAPLCPFRYQYWWNIAVIPQQLEIYDGSQWVPLTQLDTVNHDMIYLSPVLSGTITGTYTLSGSPTILSPAISNPVLSGTVTGTYTLGGTPSITAPTISNPTITGTITGSNILPLSGLAAIPGQTLLGNSTGGTGNVTAAYTVAGTGTTISSQTGSFQTNDLLISADTHGTIQDSSAASVVQFNHSNSGGTNELAVENLFTGSGTVAEYLLVTGSSSASAMLRLLDDPTAGNRNLTLSVNSGVGGGITINASAPGFSAVLSLIGGTAADGITLSGTSEVLYSGTYSGGIMDFRAYNSSTGSGTVSEFVAQTGTAGATIRMAAQDGGSPSGLISTGSGMIGGLTLSTSAGNILLSPASTTPPEVQLSETISGGEVRFLIANNAATTNTRASVEVATNSGNGFLGMLDGASPVLELETTSGVTNGILIESAAGPITLQPSAGASAAAPQVVSLFNNSAATAEFELSNPYTTGSTVMEMVIATGTSGSTLTGAVAETGHTASFATGSGVTAGLTISTSASGATADLVEQAGRNIVLTPTTDLIVNALPIVGSGTSKYFLCIDNVTKIVYEGSSTTCN